VSISQPHVRPIVRGKARADVEFGAKISISLVDGYCYADRLSWEAYNESGDLKWQIEEYRKRFGVYPESVHADKIYRTRDNIEYCRTRDIRLSGPRLGRPVKHVDKKVAKQEARQMRKDEVDRIPVEGKFGNVKRRGTLARVMGKRLFQTILDEVTFRPIMNPEVSHEHKRKTLGRHSPHLGTKRKHSR
jgi:hypothetical protein